MLSTSMAQALWKLITTQLGPLYSFETYFMIGIHSTYDGSLGTVPIYMSGIGYTVSPLFKIDASYSYRGV